jgi:hypothetical protein
MLKAQKIALVELGNSHHECLYAQVAYLKSHPKCSIRIYCSPAIAELIAPWADSAEVEILRQKLRWPDYYGLYRKISKSEFNTVIFNTGQGSLIRKLLLFPFAKTISFVAILHNINYLETSRSQIAISHKVKKYLVLNDYLLQSLAKKSYPKLEFSSYYPVLYPSYPEVEIAKPLSEIWVVIPGQVENHQRDYPTLINSLIRQKPPVNIRFILLGDSQHEDSQLLKDQIQQAGLSPNFKIWPDLIASDEFYSYIKLADFIMPLIHSNHSSGQSFQSQVSGTYNLAFAFRKCFLMDQAYKEIEDFKDSSEFYDPKNINEFLQTLKPHKKEDLYQNQKWSFHYQASKFWSFIEN